jgi:hypothetical protein
MTEFRENLIVSTNLLMWVIIGLYLVVLFFNPTDLSDEEKFPIMIWASISFFSLSAQVWFIKIVDIFYDFLKNYEIKKKN